MVSLDLTGLFIKQDGRRSRRLCFYLDWTIYDAQQLARLIKKNGGYTVNNPSIADYIVASTISDSYLDKAVIPESYITDCISAGGLLPTKNYTLKNSRRHNDEVKIESIRKILRSKPRRWEKITDHSFEIASRDVEHDAQTPPDENIETDIQLPASEQFGSVENSVKDSMSMELDSENPNSTNNNRTANLSGSTELNNNIYSSKYFAYQFLTYCDYYPQPKMSNTRETRSNVSKNAYKSTPAVAETFPPDESTEELQIMEDSDSYSDFQASPSETQEPTVQSDEEMSAQALQQMSQDNSYACEPEKEVSRKSLLAVLEAESEQAKNTPHNSPQDLTQTVENDISASTQLFDQSTEDVAPATEASPVFLQSTVADGQKSPSSPFRGYRQRRILSNSVSSPENHIVESQIPSAPDASPSNRLRKKMPSFTRPHRYRLTGHDDHIILTAVTCPAAQKLKRSIACILIGKILIPERTGAAIDSQLKLLEKSFLRRSAAESAKLDDDDFDNLEKFQKLCLDELAEEGGADKSRRWTAPLQYEPFTKFDWSFSQRSHADVNDTEAYGSDIVEDEPVADPHLSENDGMTHEESLIAEVGVESTASDVVPYKSPSPGATENSAKNSSPKVTENVCDNIERQSPSWVVPDGEEESEEDDSEEIFTQLPREKNPTSIARSSHDFPSPLSDRRENVRAFGNVRSVTKLLRQSPDDFYQRILRAAEESDKVTELMNKLDRSFEKETFETRLHAIYVSSLDLRHAVDYLIAKQNDQDLPPQRGIWTAADDEKLMNDDETLTGLMLGNKHGMKAVLKRKQFLTKFLS